MSAKKKRTRKPTAFKPADVSIAIDETPIEVGLPAAERRADALADDKAVLAGRRTRWGGAAFRWSQRARRAGFQSLAG